MVITCYSCSTSFSLDESLLKPEGTKVRCSRCKHFFKVYPPVQKIVAELENISEQGPGSTIGMMTEDDKSQLKSDFSEFDYLKGHMALGGTLADPREKDLPGLDLNESEFDYLELTDLVIDTDLDMETVLGIEENSPSMGSFSDSPHFESRNNESELKPPEEYVPELELEIDVLGLGIEQDQPDGEGFDSIDFDLETNDPKETSTQMLISDDDPEFELEFSADPEPGPTGESHRLEKEYNADPSAFSGRKAFSEYAGDSEQVPDTDVVFIEDPKVIETDDVNNDHFEKSAREKIGQTRIENLDMARLGMLSGASLKGKNSIFIRPAAVLPLILLIVAGALVASLMAGYRIPGLSNIRIPYLGQILKKDGVKKIDAAPVPSQKNLIAKYVENSIAGKLFVITGSVENPSKISYSHIQVKGALITKDDKLAKTGFAFCGNIIPDELLKTGKLSDINAALDLKKGSHDSNVNINPGASVPYMLVFSGLPDQLRTFTVQVSAYDEN